jgi:outer membrane protein assembly factor BamB
MHPRQPRLIRILLSALALFAVLAVPVLADDWPQWLGSHRDGISAETGLLKTWPAPSGPPLVWDKEVGEGFSGPVIVGKRLILFHRVGDKEVVECLDALKGTHVWTFDYATSYVDNFGKGNGPRSTPTVVGNRVYTLGAEGMLHCLDLESGKKVWARSLPAEYKIPANFFGVGTSPLVEGDLLLVNVGGKGAGIVAFRTKDGSEAWKATTDGASYSSPVAVTIDGQRLAVFFTRQGVVLLDPADGKVRYEKRWRSTNNASVNAATPVVVGDLLFFSACYETGALLLRVSKKGVDEVWSGEDILSNHFCTSVPFNGYLYGIDGRQEAGASLRCVELKGGKVRWTKEGFGCASMVLAEGHLFALTERGDLVLVELSPDGYKEKARSTVFKNLPCRAQLALANGLLYARDGARLVCWNVRK